MKRFALLLGCVSFFVGFAAAQQPAKRSYYKGLPVLRSNKDTLFISVGTYKSNGWVVSPQLEMDTLRFGSVLPLEARFVSDIDSIGYVVGPGESRHFYVSRGNVYAHTVVHNRAAWSTITYGNNCLADTLQFLFDARPQAVAYYNRLREQYAVDSCIKDARNDADRVLRLLHWTHMQWKHNGNQAPQKTDALSILDEVKTGKGFPCFAYAEVLRAALNSVGIPARRLALKTKGVETEQSASGHVANEVWLRDEKKWVFVDPQEDVMPYLGNKPLNAVEFQQAVTTYKDKVELRSLSPVSKADYFNFVYPYLYFFDTNFDQRYGVDTKKNFAGKTSMMLVPKGNKNPTKAGFYGNQAIDYCLYTNCLRDFYKPPVLK